LIYAPGAESKFEWYYSLRSGLIVNTKSRKTEATQSISSIDAIKPETVGALNAVSLDPSSRNVIDQSPTRAQPNVLDSIVFLTSPTFGDYFQSSSASIVEK
jgi:hypothetical protein